MADIKLVYKLKQQSPMIHFQYDEDGVCLRASEVKPKLDRFLTERLLAEKGPGGESWQPWKDEEYQAWYGKGSVADGHEPALCYKMKITQPDSKPVISDDIPGAYFGNMGKNHKYSVFYSDSVNLEIICFQEKLRKFINEYIDLFFLCTNFGTRQNKGYGSFVIEGKEDPKRLKVLGKRIWVIRDNQDDGKPTPALKDIANVYAIMKSGINLTKVNPNKPNYVKGFLFKYFLEPSLRDSKKYRKREIIKSDKAFVKEKIVCKNDDRQSQHPQPTQPTYRYVRGLLGINDGVNYKTYGRMVYNKPEGIPTVTINVKNDSMERGDIERFASPITFKVIGNAIYVIPEKIPKRISGAKFCFLKKGEESNLAGKEDYCLYIPWVYEDKEHPIEFNLEDFLEKFAAAFNDKELFVWGSTKTKKKDIHLSDLTNGRLNRMQKLTITELK